MRPRRIWRCAICHTSKFVGGQQKAAACDRGRKPNRVHGWNLVSLPRVNAKGDPSIWKRFAPARTAGRKPSVRVLPRSSLCPVRSMSRGAPSGATDGFGPGPGGVSCPRCAVRVLRGLDLPSITCDRSRGRAVWYDRWRAPARAVSSPASPLGFDSLFIVSSGRFIAPELPAAPRVKAWGISSWPRNLPRSGRLRRSTLCRPGSTAAKLNFASIVWPNLIGRTV
jgi:hypothetical protein